MILEQKNSFWQKLEKPIMVLAPMEDVTDSVYRRMINRHAPADVYFTEFTSADGLFSKGADSAIQRLRYLEEERPIVAQIWGNKPENFYRAGKLLRELRFDGIDINLGCPVKKIVKHGACSALINNQPLTKELIQALKESAPDMALSVKTRLGFKKLQTEEWCGFLLDQGLDALTIHGRIASEMSKKSANWFEVEKAVKLRDAICPKTIIIGNGDVKDHTQARVLSEKHKVDGVMIGRGIFNNLLAFDPNGLDFNSFSREQKIEVLKVHAREFVEFWGKERPFKVVKKFFKNYITGFPGASALRAKLVRTNSLEELEEVCLSIKEFYENP